MSLKLCAWFQMGSYSISRMRGFIVLKCHCILPILVSKWKDSLHFIVLDHHQFLLKFIRALFLDKRIVGTIVLIIICILFCNLYQLTRGLEAWTTWEWRLFSLFNQLSSLFVSYCRTLIRRWRSRQSYPCLTSWWCLLRTIEAAGWFAHSQSITDRSHWMSVAK